jgi:hypothetical protein
MPKKLAAETCQDLTILYPTGVCTVQCTVCECMSVSCTDLPQILLLLFCLLIYIHLNHLWAHASTVIPPPTDTKDSLAARSKQNN